MRLARPSSAWQTGWKYPTMFNNDSYKLFFPLILVGLALPFFVALAQDGSAGLPNETPSSTILETVATSAATAVPTSRAVVPQSTSPAPIAAPAQVNPTPTPTSSPVQNMPSTEDTDSNPILWVALAALAILPFGYLAAQSLKKKKTKEAKEDDSRCFDIKKLLDKKLEELADLRGKLEGKAHSLAREKIREATQGTSTGDILALVEKAEKEYGRLKKLFDECMLEFGKPLFKGTIIENSLNNKSILDKVKTEKTYQSGDWILHDVHVREDQISELQKYITDGPWYMHFLEPGKDDIKVVFKNKIFTIKFSDRSTWTEAVAYGKSIGVLVEQLDFPID